MGNVSATIGKLQLTGGNPNGGEPSAAICGGIGSPSGPLITALTGKNFLDFRMKSTGTSGTSRGFYTRLYLSSGAGGECIRAFTTVENNTPADTCNGAHISLNFGSTAGNITGLGTAVRGTLHVPGRSLGGTVAALQAEIYGDAASGAIGGTASLIRGIVDGHSDLKDSFDDNGFVLDLQGLTAGAAHAFRTGLTANNSLALMTAALRIKIGSTTYFLPVLTGTNG